MQWDQVASPSIPWGGEFNSVDAVSANDVWAVGRHRGGLASRTLTEHWDGVQWSIISSPNTDDEDENALFDVTAISSNDVWVVGSNDPRSDLRSHTLAMHWNGIQWSFNQPPSPGLNENALYSVSAVYPNDVWAVGYYRNYQPIYLPQPSVVHWNGISWEQVGTPSLGSDGGMLFGVTVLAPNNVWAVGYYSGGVLIEHWDGTQWSQVSSPSGGNGAILRTLAAVSPSDIWAFGESSQGPLAMHWDGAQWSLVSVPNPGGAALCGAAAVGTENVWVVGGYSSLGQTRTLTEWYRGSCGL